MSFTLNNPFQYWNNPNNSNPVGLGKLYVGLPDTDPEQVGNRVTVKAVQPNGAEITLTQPVQLLAGGVPELNGSPVQLKIDAETVSVKVTTSAGAQVYYTERWSAPSKGMLPDTFVADLAALNSSVLIAGVGAADIANEYRFQREFRADAYGLKESNNGLQNCLALQALSAAVQAAGGGKVKFPKGTYRVGAQTLAGATGKGYAYLFEPMFDVRNLPNGGLHIDFDNTKFELEDGLKFGAFDPVTGTPLINTPPNFDNDTQAGTGYVFVTVNVRDILVTGKCEIDGRDSARIIGGFFGDQGRQCTEYGFQFINYRRLKMEGMIYCHHLLLDGLYTLCASTADDCYTVIDGYVGLNNSRQAWSCCGGSNNFLINSVLGLTGYNRISTSPAAGVDLEPEGTPIFGFQAINCYFPRSKGPCYVCDNFNVNAVRFTQCEFENTEFSSVYSVLKDVTFDTCTFRGAVYNVIAGTHPSQRGDRPKFKNCDFYDRTRDGAFARRFAGTGGNGGILFNTVQADFEDCRWDAEISTTYPVIGFMDGSNLRNVTLTVRGVWTPMTGYEVFYCRNSGYIENFTVNNVGTGEQSGNAVSSLAVSGTKRIVNCFITQNASGAQNTLVWDFPDLSSGARSGARRNEDVTNGQAWVQLAMWRQGSGATSTGQAGAHRLTSYSTTPADGSTFIRGDIAFNHSPSPSTTPAWVCTTSGIAGSTAVFKPYANVGA